MNLEIKTPTRSGLRPLWPTLLVLALTSVARAQFYAITDVGTLGGTNAMIYSINNHEQIVGTAQTDMGQYHAFRFDAGRMIDLGTMGGTNSWAYGINDNGWMVGASDMPMTNIHAFLCTNALMNPTMMDLGTLGGSNSVAWMIDMHGEIVGWAGMTNGSQHAFFMTNFLAGDMMDLGTAGGTGSTAYCINNNHMVVGEAMMSPGNMLPIMSTNPMSGSPSMMTMRMSGMGASGGGSWSLNNMGDTAGQADMPAGNHHATVSGNGGMMGQRTIDLGALGGTNSIAYYINDAGAVVGTAQLAGGMMHAFMVTNALGGMVRMIDLNDLIPTNSGWQLVEARGMNAAGQIVGWGMFAGHTNGFLLTPVSAPVMMTSSPSTQIVGPGTMVTLGMQMSASERLTYQWLQNGVPIAGATNATFTLPSGMSMENAGQYTVTARNGVGTVASSSAVVSMFSMQLTNGSPHLSVAAPSGSHFRIDYSDMLVNSANWQAMTNFTVTGSITQVIDTPPARRDSRYYRAVMTP